ncbi:MAG: TIGR02996 domain-containing protein [Myxococcales bacterium]|nr:TIGR02996 domain-containing protein [Myxococcales bacterium]
MDDLHQALLWWRDHRDPKLAHVVRRLDAELGSEQHVAGDAEDHITWLAVAATATHLDVSPLLATLTHGRCPQAIQRLHVVWSMGPDPRVVDAVLGWIRDLRFRSHGSKGEWWSLLLDIASQGVGPQFDFVQFGKSLFLDDQSNFARRMSKRVGALTYRGPAHTELSPAARTRLDGWLARWPLPRAAATADPHTVAKLLDAIAADPDHDGPRAVLADLLAQTGDDRGAFIAAQLSGARRDGRGLPVTPRERDQPWEQRQLLRNQGARWFGPWVHQLCDAFPERGFLRHVDVSRRKPRHLPKMGDEPGLRTVRSMTFRARSSGSTKSIARLLGSPSLANLSHVSGLRPDDLPGLRQLPALTRVGIEDIGASDIDAVLSLPHLERLDFHMADLAPAELARLALPHLGLCLMWQSGCDPEQTLSTLHAHVRTVTLAANGPVGPIWERVVRLRRGASDDWGLDLSTRLELPADAPVLVDLALLDTLPPLPTWQDAGPRTWYEIGPYRPGDAIRALSWAGPAPVWVNKAGAPSIDALAHVPIGHRFVLEPLHTSFSWVTALQTRADIQVAIRGPSLDDVAQLQRGEDGRFIGVRGTAEALHGAGRALGPLASQLPRSAV